MTNRYSVGMLNVVDEILNERYLVEVSHNLQTTGCHLRQSEEVQTYSVHLNKSID